MSEREHFISIWYFIGLLLTVYGVSDGQPIVRSANGATQWSGILPATQDYMIILSAPGHPSLYALQISIKYG